MSCFFALFWLVQDWEDTFEINVKPNQIMNLINYYRPLGIKHPSLHKFFENNFDDLTASANQLFVPAVDLSETDKEYTIHVSIPGIKKENIVLDIKGRVLTVSGERTFEKENKDKNYYKIETSYGAFKRAFELPEGANVANVQASYQDGILEVLIPKEATVDTVKKVEIK